MSMEGEEEEDLGYLPTREEMDADNYRWADGSVDYGMLGFGPEDEFDAEAYLEDMPELSSDESSDESSGPTMSFESLTAQILETKRVMDDMEKRGQQNTPEYERLTYSWNFELPDEWRKHRGTARWPPNFVRDARRRLGVYESATVHREARLEDIRKKQRTKGNSLVNEPASASAPAHESSFAMALRNHLDEVVSSDYLGDF